MCMLCYSNLSCILAAMVKRKTMVLDLDETLIHSHHDGVLRQTVKPGTPADFVLKVNVRTTLPFMLMYVRCSKIDFSINYMCVHAWLLFVLCNKIASNVLVIKLSPSLIRDALVNSYRSHAGTMGPIPLPWRW